MPDFSDTVPFARALIEAAPDRCVWGSDWPHVGFWGPMPNVGALLALTVDWSPDEAIRHAIFVENPHRLYGFEETLERNTASAGLAELGAPVVSPRATRPSSGSRATAERTTS